MVFSSNDVGSMFNRVQRAASDRQSIGSAKYCSWLGLTTLTLVLTILLSWINLVFFHTTTINNIVFPTPQVADLAVHPVHSEALDESTTTNSESHFVAAVLETNTTAFTNSILKPPRSPQAGKPKFVFHIGPPKTGSTTIQCGLAKYSKLLADLDHLYFVGASCGEMGRKMARKPLENGEIAMLGGIVHAMLGVKYDADKDPFLELKERIDRHYPLANSIVFSVEGLSRWLPDRPKTWEKLQSLFADSPYEVEVVVYYRNYFDWLFSLYFQSYQDNRKFRFPKWENQHDTFRNFLEEHMMYFNKTLTLNPDSKRAQSLGEHMTIRSYERWSQHFNVSVIALHDEGDMVTNFLCHGTSAAPNSCRYFLSNPDSLHSTTKRVATDNYDTIRTAETAWQLGLVSPSTSIKDVLGAIRVLYYARNTSLPNIHAACLPESLANQFANASMTFHEKYLKLANPNIKRDAMDIALQEHMSKFEEAQAKGKFCQIDPVLALSDDSLRKALEPYLTKRN
eukprot:Nitzschia sp. Nitz4//scaffold34_size148208//69794//71323//NITZ4_002980-RA/size148208-processed-gene-0.44-mRNA-1//-1//CDS//3329548795//6242//frame0